MPKSRGSSKQELKRRLRSRRHQAAAAQLTRDQALSFLELVNAGLEAAGLEAEYQTAGDSPTGRERVAIRPAAGQGTPKEAA
jgi:hypothetical protein